MAAAFLRIPNACVISRGIVSIPTPISKFSWLRSVCAPHNLSAGTFISPIESCSMRYSIYINSFDIVQGNGGKRGTRTLLENEPVRSSLGKNLCEWGWDMSVRLPWVALWSALSKAGAFLKYPDRRSRLGGFRHSYGADRSRCLSGGAGSVRARPRCPLRSGWTGRCRRCRIRRASWWRRS